MEATMRLDGKVAVVTAAGQGIGKASVLAMAREGAEVWATDVRSASLAAFNGAANIKTAILDVLDQRAIDEFFSALPKIDVLFNCAGVVHNGTILEATDDE